LPGHDTQFYFCHVQSRAVLSCQPSNRLNRYSRPPFAPVRDPTAEQVLELGKMAAVVDMHKARTVEAPGIAKIGVR
jgi:hypothetical protein